MTILSLTKSITIPVLMTVAIFTTASHTTLSAATLSTQLNPSPVNKAVTYNKNITKAECLKKPGYVWIEADKICVRPSRGSH